MAVVHDPCLQSWQEVMGEIRFILRGEGCSLETDENDLLEVTIENLGDFEKVKLLITVEESPLDFTEAVFTFSYLYLGEKRLVKGVKEMFVEESKAFSERLLREAKTRRFELLYAEGPRRGRVEVGYLKVPCSRSTTRYICREERERIIEELFRAFRKRGYQPVFQNEGSGFYLAGEGAGRGDRVEVWCCCNGILVVVNDASELVEPPLETDRVVSFVEGFAKLILKREL